VQDASAQLTVKFGRFYLRSNLLLEFAEFTGQTIIGRLEEEALCWANEKTVNPKEYQHYKTSNCFSQMQPLNRAGQHYDIIGE